MKIAREGEALRIYLEDEGEGEIRREWTYPMEGKRIPKNPQGSPEGSLGHQRIAFKSSESVGEGKREIWMKGCGSPFIYPGT
jgi:hypothetical protein